MTFSEKYIMVCRAATEIQELKCIGKDDDTTSFSFNLTDYVGITYLDICLQCTTVVQAKDIPKFIYNGTEIDRFWIPDFHQLLKIYADKKDCKFESMSLLYFCNWFEDRVKEDHGFCLKYRTKEEIAILWVMEECYGKAWGGEKFQCQQ